MQRLAAALLLALWASGTALAQANPCSSSNNHCVVLTWTASPTAGVVGYNVYRGPVAGGEGATPLNAAPVAAGCSGVACTWTDNYVAAGQTYYYVLTAVASDRVTQSARSNEVAPVIPVFPPANLTVAAQ